QIPRLQQSLDNSLYVSQSQQCYRVTLQFLVPLYRSCSVRAASFQCFEEMNTRNDRFGNCVLKQCGFAHILCGKLICTWPYRKIVSGVNISSAYTHVRDGICISLYKGGRVQRQTITTYEVLEDRDETFIDDGTVCGPDMFCIDARCRETRFFMDLQLCSVSSDCNNHGICNNFNHCHCDKGYYPPFCDEMEGEFGSIDDGHKVIANVTNASRYAIKGLKV
ncbi:disintegrin and metalloproteinase domain-containing protein 5 isoform X1, partial [Sigmodon hispidus]